MKTTVFFTDKEVVTILERHLKSLGLRVLDSKNNGEWEFDCEPAASNESKHPIISPVPLSEHYFKFPTLFAVATQHRDNNFTQLVTQNTDGNKIENFYREVIKPGIQPYWLLTYECDKILTSIRAGHQ